MSWGLGLGAEDQDCGMRRFTGPEIRLAFVV